MVILWACIVVESGLHYYTRPKNCHNMCHLGGLFFCSKTNFLAAEFSNRVLTLCFKLNQLNLYCTLKSYCNFEIKNYIMSSCL